MFRKTMATAVLLVAAMTAQADVGISADVITTGNEIKVLRPLLGPDLDLHKIIKKIVDSGSPGEGNPYLIKLGPGEHTILPNPDDASNGLVMKPYISIVGSGQGVTVLKGAISSGAIDSSSAIVTTASNAVLSDLSVDNTGGSNVSIAINHDGAVAMRIERVTATASGASFNFGVFTTNSPLTMTNLTITATGGDFSYGVYDTASSRMTGVTVTASGGSSENFGVHIAGSSPTMTSVTATASGGSNSSGVYNSAASSAPLIMDSVLKGGSFSMDFGGSAGTRIINSQLKDGINADLPSVQCRDTYDGDLADVTC